MPIKIAIGTAVVTGTQELERPFINTVVVGDKVLYTGDDNVSPKANQLANFPLNFLRTGFYYYSDGKMYSRTTNGNWWSATRSSATYANYLNTTTSLVNPQSSSYRGYGFALRCVAR